MAVSATDVQKAYLAYFGRPADPVGLAYWMGQDAVTMKAGFAASVEYATLYAGMTSTQMVAQVYTNLLGREADVTGLLYWSGEMAAGRQTVSTLVDSMQANVLSIDIATIANRVTYATAFTAALDTTAEIVGYSGTAAATAARAAVSAVVDTTASLTAAQTALATSIATVVSTGTAATGSTFTLTTNVDSLTGTTGNDTFNADNTGTTAVLSAADVVTGAAGTDTLNIYSAGTAFNLPTLSSIETVNIYDQDDNQSIATAAWASVTEANLIRGDGALTLTGGANLATVGVSDVVAASGGVVLAFEAARTTATVNLNGVTAANAAADENVDVNGAALTTVTVNTTGTASSFDVLDVASATTIAINAAVGLTATSLETGATAAALTITGAGAVSLGTLDTAINTVTASGNSGGVTADIGAEVDTVFTGSTGNDVITAGSTDALVTADTLAVNAGDGTADVLVIAATIDVDTAADGARYTNFEIVRTGDSYDGDLVAGITALQLTGASSKSYTDLTATQAANIQVRGDETSATFALKTPAGTADVLTLTMGTGLTTSAATDIVTGMTVTGFETLNIIENGGATASAGADRTAIVAAFTGATLNDINLSGRAVTLSNIATTVAVNIDGSALTGNGATSGAQGLTVAGSAVAGSVITGSAVRDSFTVGAEGSTYNGGAGNDAFSATVALIAADGATDLVLNGDAGTDTLTLSNTTGNTLTDTHFTNVHGFEALTLTNTGAADTSITTGAAFNAAFADGVTITSGVIAATYDITVAAGLSTVATTVSIAATSQTGAATEINTITTGSGADSVTYTDTDWVGVTGVAAQGQIIIDTRGGNDTISVTVGTLLANSDGTDTAVVITGGAGTDSITKVGTNGNDINGVAHYVFAAGDSSTTAWDSITGFDVSNGTYFSDGLNFEGTAAVSAFAATEDFGTIKSHSVTAGIVTLDDAADFSTALVINATNLADVVGYLQANVAANGTVAFTYDSDASGTADATMVFHQGSASGVADDLVLLVGVTAADALVTTNAAGANDLFIA